ncbi:protein-tyrosine phosphatase family protein [Halocola ammonii]
MSRNQVFTPFLLLCVLSVSAGCNFSAENEDKSRVPNTHTMETPQDSSSSSYKIYPFPVGDNFVAISPLPGKENLEEDVKMLKDQNITAVVSLVSKEELKEKGLTNFFEVFESHGIEVYHSPIVDYGLPEQSQMDSILNYVQSQLDSGENVLVHCMGGYGRSGTVMGSYANAILGVDDPIEYVRETRGQDAIETKEQEEFVRSYTNLVK